MEKKKEWFVFYIACGDGYTYGYDKFIPFQYSSKKDVEDALLEYAYGLLESYLKSHNAKDYTFYYDWMRDNKFFDTFEFDVNDFWFRNDVNPGRVLLHISHFEMNTITIYTLQEWAEANEEKVKYLQKDG